MKNIFSIPKFIGMYLMYRQPYNQIHAIKMLFDDALRIISFGLSKIQITWYTVKKQSHQFYKHDMGN